MASNFVLEATVKRVNGKGIAVEEQEGWVNYSKWALPEDVVTPPVGARVALTLDKDGFIRKIAPLASPAPVAQAAEPGAAPSRELLIVRQTCLKAAAQMAGERSVEDVLTIAETFERWALRPEGGVA